MFSESKYATERSTRGKKLKVRAPKWTFDDLMPGQDTGVFARTLFHALSDGRVKNIHSDSLRNLIYWHAIEEIEHKHVAFDVLRAVDDNYVLRISGILFLAVTMPAWVGLGFIYLLAQEKDVKIADVLRDLVADASSGSGLTRQFVNAFFSYFRPGFHPDDLDDAALVAEIAAEVEKSISRSGAA